jgi:hypothetical protein
MANVLAGSNDKEKLDDLITRTHKDQAVWFLNAIWEVRLPPSIFCLQNLSLLGL